MRDDGWLEERLDYIWRKYFSDVEKVNEVSIKFSRPSKFRFGSIRLVRDRFFRPSESRILINGNFKTPKVPVSVIDYTIAHELAHYSHGFSSGHTQFHRYPHHGGIVNKELIARGMGRVISSYKLWLKSYRETLRSRTRIRRRRTSGRWVVWPGRLVLIRRR